MLISSFQLNKIPRLKYKPVTNEIWDTISIEGLDEEFDLERKDFSYAILPISRKDKALLKTDKTGDSGIFEKYNDFDWELKEKYKMKFIDFIDEENGVVRIIKCGE
jgi:hypothetical protein